MARLKTYNNRRTNKALSSRQIEQRKAARYVRQFRKFFPKLRAWQRRFAMEFMNGPGGTITGRMTSQPEMQFLRPGIGKTLPPREVVYLDIDYKGVEERMIAALASKSDVHSELAKQMFGVTDADTRHRAKTINYLSVYGASASTISKHMKGSK